MSKFGVCGESVPSFGSFGSIFSEQDDREISSSPLEPLLHGRSLLRILFIRGVREERSFLLRRGDVETLLGNFGETVLGGAMGSSPGDTPEEVCCGMSFVLVKTDEGNVSESLGEGGHRGGGGCMLCRRRAPLEASSLICLRWASVRPGRDSETSITRTSVGPP